MADLKISQFVDGGAVQTTDEIATSRSGINTKVFVGGAASLDANGGVGDVVVLQDDGSGNPQYPAFDGSEILNINIGPIDASNVIYSPETGTIITSNNVQDAITELDAILVTKLAKDEPVVTASITGTYNIDYNAGQVWDLTATGDCDIDIINPPSGGASIPVKIVQDSTPRTIDFVISGLTWANGAVPIMPAASGDFLWVLFVTDDGGATWTGFDCGLVEP